MQIIPQRIRLQQAKALRLHLEHQVVNLPALFRERPRKRRRTRHIGGIAIRLGGGVDEEVQPAVQGLVVLEIVQRRRIGAGCDDGVVRLLRAGILNARFYEHGFELALVRRTLGFAKDGGVREGRDVVCIADESDFVGVFDDAAVVDGGFEEGRVDVAEVFWGGEVVR